MIHDRTRLNILINRVVNGERLHNDQGKQVLVFTGVRVVVRYGYTPISEDDAKAEGKAAYVHVWMDEKYDPDAINNLGQRGAVSVNVDEPRVRRAVARLLEQWGPIAVQDNSGRFADLATAPGVLTI